jgi:hypothetical protein
MGALKKRARVIPPLGFRSSAFQPGAESKAEEFMSEKAQSPTVQVKQQLRPLPNMNRIP